MATNGNEVYEARKKYAKEEKKGDVKRGGDRNNKDNNSAVIGRIRKIHVI